MAHSSLLAVRDLSCARLIAVFVKDERKQRYEFEEVVKEADCMPAIINSKRNSNWCGVSCDASQAFIVPVELFTGGEMLRTAAAVVASKNR